MPQLHRAIGTCWLWPRSEWSDGEVRMGSLAVKKDTGS